MALAEHALTTVATVTDRLTLGSGSEVARLEGIINAASAIASLCTGRRFHSITSNTARVIGEPGPMLFLPDAPINSIASITFQGVALNAGDYEIYGDGTSGIVYHLGGSWVDTALSRMDASLTRRPGTERKSYLVTYNSGWITPNQDEDNRTLPEDIEEAVIAIASTLRRSMGRDPAITSERLMSASVSYSDPSQGINVDWLRARVPMASMILDKYAFAHMR